MYILIILIMIILIFFFMGATNREVENEKNIINYVDSIINRGSYTPIYLVTKITDGDTIILDDNIKVRLSYIDAYEKNHPMHQKIMEYMNFHVMGKNVHVIFHGDDKYGRKLASIYLPDGSCLNDNLVSLGYAGVYDKYCDKSTDNYKALKQKELAASVRQTSNVYKTVSYYRLLKDYFKF